MATIDAPNIAASGLRSYLLRTLPAKVTAINLLRAPVLKSPLAGPFTLPVGGSISLRIAEGASTQSVSLTSGSRTAAQIATEINATIASAASADAQGRLVLTGAAPTSTTPGVVEVSSSSTAAVMTALGFSPGGAKLVRSALGAPGLNGVLDGEFVPMDPGSGMAVVLGDRSVEPRSSNVRDDMRRVAFKVQVLAAEPSNNFDSFMELLNAATRCVREVLAEDRTLDSAVFLTEVTKETAIGRIFRFRDGLNYPLMGMADMAVRVHVWERTEP